MRRGGATGCGLRWTQKGARRWRRRWRSCRPRWTWPPPTRRAPPAALPPRTAAMRLSPCCASPVRFFLVFSLLRQFPPPDLDCQTCAEKRGHRVAEFKLHARMSWLEFECHV